ncbi:MAG: HD-GYP domain-containing protein, partial [Gammaproteobacteria bacterium]|nr:HD-GYP domain-containing protein [Gammaproteobacteria bacterium]
ALIAVFLDRPLLTRDDMADTDDKQGLIKTPISELAVGMYVAKLDRPWLETSFEVQGFYARDRETIDRLGNECDHVYVDPRRFKRMDAAPRLRIVVSNDSPKEIRYDKPKKPAPPLRQIAPRKPQSYADSIDTADEATPAQTSIDDAISIMQPIVEKVRVTGKLEIDQIEAAVNPLVSSVLRNKDAVAALLRIRSLDDYTYSHSISNAVWAAVLGRHLGFKPTQINQLALGCALLDVGKVTIPKELLNKSGELSDAEWDTIHRHVDAGLAILEESSVTDRDVITMVGMHHERIDGSGYPKGLIGKAISAYGQIAGIIDTYDAMITERPYAPAMSSYDAVHTLHRYVGVLFQEDLVEHLTQAIGVFPTGTLVELNTGEVGVVTAQNPERRLRPKVNLILTEDKKPRTQPIVTDLHEMDVDIDKAPKVWIKRELAQGAFGIDAARYFA